MSRILMAMFPYLLVFLTGGFAGAVLVGPRVAWWHGMAPQRSRGYPDEPRPLMINVAVPPGGREPALREAALQQAAALYPGMQLHAGDAAGMYIGSSGLLHGCVPVSCLGQAQPERVAADDGA